MRELIPEIELKFYVDKVALEIRRDYDGKAPILLGVLNGAYVFLADLSRRLAIPHDVQFVGVESYSGTSSTGVFRVRWPREALLRGRDVIIVEDIVDTGRTLSKLLKLLPQLEPRSVKVCTLLSKPSRREVEVPLDYVGLEIPDVFVIGYGMDLDGQYRHLRSVFTLDVRIDSCSK